MNRGAAFSQPSTNTKPNTKPNTKQRLWYADILRIAAIGMVILIHVASKDFHRVPVDSFHWQFLNTVNGLGRISVPLLFMVSGIFFLSPQKNVPTRSIFTKYIWRLVRAFIFWSAVYLLYRTIPDPPDLTTEAVEETAWEFIRGNFHLWFLYRLAEVYAIVPILRPLAKNKKLILYFLAVSFIVGFLTPTYRQFPIRSTDTLADNGINFDITLGYSGYMMLGYYLHHYGLPRKWKRGLYALGVIGSAVTVIGTSILSFQEGQLYAIFYEYLTPNVFFASAAAFLFAKNRLFDKSWQPKTQSIILKLSKYSFGMYLIHVLIRDILWRAGWNTTLFHPLLSVPISAAVIALISYFLTAIFSRINGIRKLIS